MPGLVPGIHVFKTSAAEDVDGRDKPGHDEAKMSPRTATLIGLTAILMWSLLSVMTVATGKIPAFQLAAMTFAIGGLVGLLTWIGRGAAAKSLRQPLVVWIVGVGGLFGYHADRKSVV